MRQRGIPMMAYRIQQIRPAFVAGAMWPYPTKKKKENKTIQTILTNSLFIARTNVSIDTEVILGSWKEFVDYLYDWLKRNYMSSLFRCVLFFTLWGRGTSDPGLEPHQCLYICMWNGTSRLPCWLPRAQQVSHQRRIWILCFMWVTRHVSEVIHPGFETQKSRIGTHFF